MIRYLQSHFAVKLFLSYLVVILVGILVLALASQWILPAAFSRHMQGMPGGMMSGAAGEGMMQGLYSDFRSSFNDALLSSGLAAVLAAALLAFFLSRRVVAPLRDIMDASRRISEGQYEERVGVGGHDELGQLADRFNRMAEKLAQVESMRRRLIGDVSHELRTPLTAIKGSMEGLLDGILPATPQTFGEIHAEADRLGRLVDDLQELSRVEAGAYALEIRPVDITMLARTVVKRLASQLETRHIVLDLDLPAKLPAVLADEDRTVQVLTNLVANAIQYSVEGGKIRVSGGALDGQVQVLVQDDGIGIPAGHLPHIFDRFYRVDKSRSRRSGGGSGIGLTISKHLLEAMGGRIWVESAGVGRGSVFGFTLPAAVRVHQ